jgi:hypothetical protein
MVVGMNVVVENCRSRRVFALYGEAEILIYQGVTSPRIRSFELQVLDNRFVSFLYDTKLMLTGGDF